MKLQKPKNNMIIIAVVLVALGVLGTLVMIPFVSGIAFWLVIAGFVVMVVGSLSPQDSASLDAGAKDVPQNASDLKKPQKPKNTGLQIAISLGFAVVGYVLGSQILPMLSFTSWERHAASQNASYLGGLNSAYSDAQVLGGILGGILFFVLGMVVMNILCNKPVQDR